MKINLGSNIKYLREKKGLDQQQLSEILNVPRSTLACWENNIRTPKLEQIIKIAEYFKTDLDIIYANFDNASPIDINPDNKYIKIPVLGVIKAGIPIEAQQDILEYIDVPKSWTKGGKELFGLRISGDSMFPKYNEGDTVVFEKNNDFETANNKDVAIMINGDDATFKKLLINTEGITLVPYNTGAYELMMYSNKDIEEKPIRIIGIARKIIKEV